MHSVFRVGIMLVLSICLFLNFTKPRIEENWPEKVEKVKKMKDKDTIVIVHEWFYHKSFVYYWDIGIYQDYRNSLAVMNQQGVKFMDPTGLNLFLKDANPLSCILVLHKGHPYSEFELVLKAHGYKLDFSDIKLKPNLYKFIIDPTKNKRNVLSQNITTSKN